MNTQMKRSDRKPLGCGICPYKTNSACHLERHLRIHTGQKPYACDMCSYRATDGGLLKRHMRIHSGEKPFTCQICGHRTAQSCSLKDHMAVHTGKKRYACDICPFQCSRIGRLRDHQLQHKAVTIKKEDLSDQSNQQENLPEAEEKLTTCKCTQCGLEFPGMPNLNRHIATAHLKTPVLESSNLTSHGTATEMPFHCSLCSASADTPETLNTHFTRHILYRCLECDSTFESPAELIAHGPDHSEEFIFDCDKCDFKSKTRNELRGHERKHSSSQSLICTECSFVSKSNIEFAQHLQTHTSSEMVQCNICSTKFSKTNDLREHMVIHYSRSRARPVRKQMVIVPESNVLSNIETLHCYYCSYKCSEEDQMARHIQEVHVTPSVSSEQHISKDGNKKIVIDSKNNEKSDGTPQFEESNAIAPHDICQVSRKIPHVDSLSKPNFDKMLKGHKLFEFEHCPCSSYGFRWLRNLECRYQHLSHFMNPNAAGFPEPLHPFHPGKCRSCSMYDPDLSTVTKDKVEASQSSAANTNNDVQHPLKHSVELHSSQKDHDAPDCLQGLAKVLPIEVDDQGSRPSADLERQCVKYQDTISTCTRNQIPIDSEPNKKKLKADIDVQGSFSYNVENGDQQQDFKCVDTQGNEDRNKNSDILLSKLRQFFNETFPKISCSSEGDSDQSTLTANTTAHDILTIELSSDSNGSDHNY